jgi:hypothetical protein
MIERRTATSDVKTGLIVFNDGRSTLGCVIRNLSDTGAMLKVEIWAGLPDSLSLRLDQKIVGCTAVRRTLTEIAVRFVHPENEFDARSLPAEEAAMCRVGCAGCHGAVRPRTSSSMRHRASD